jgi:uncharacterized protein YdaU (DUF1376 family)
MPLWVGDFLLKTGDLDARETGAYLLLLMAMWSRDGSLPADQKKLQRVAKCGREWPSVWAAIGHYFEEADGRITNRRLTEELRKVCAKREVNQHNGGLGGRAKALKDKEAALANASVSPQQSYSESEVEKREANASPKKARGTRLSPEWFLPLDWGEWALGEGLGREAIRVEADKFKDYWTARAGPNGVKLDWQATWRNWIRAAKERGHGNGNRISGPTASGQRADPAIEQIARLTGIGAAPSDGRGGVGSPRQEDGPLWMGARPQ